MGLKEELNAKEEYIELVEQQLDSEKQKDIYMQRPIEELDNAEIQKGLSTLLNKAEDVKEFFDKIKAIKLQSSAAMVCAIEPCFFYPCLKCNRKIFHMYMIDCIANCHKSNSKKV